jgi:Zn-finger nucleic acid-binding protein
MPDMKCPNCDGELASIRRDRIDMQACPSCHGMWLTPQELTQLEDEVFDFGDDEKGSLMLGDEPTGLKCPQCAKPMKSFQYRLYDLTMDFCEGGDGFWLSADEDKRVLELMKTEEANLGRSVLAEDRFAAHLRYLQSGSFKDWLRDVATVAMDPKPKPRV